MPHRFPPSLPSLTREAAKVLRRLGASLEAESPAPTEVEAGEAFSESGRPDSNRRRPAWEAPEASDDQRPLA
jgi:hypothetical protein